MIDEPKLSRAPLLTHLLELRQRLLRVMLFFTVASVVGYLLAEPIYGFLTAPLRDAFGSAGEGRRMIYTGLQEAFLTYLKLALFTGAFVTIPLALNQVWKFLAPGLYRGERRELLPFFCMTPVLFVAGAAMAYYVVFPLAWGFFLSFENAGGDIGVAVALEARVGEYLGLVVGMVLAFGLSFELPLVLILLARVGLVTADGLARFRRHAVVLIAVVTAIITPPDLISQIALGLPLYALYEASIWIIRWMAVESAHPRLATPMD